MGELIQDLKRELREEILQGMSYERQMTDEELSQVIDGKILEQMEREPMALRDRLRLQKELFDSFRRLDILQELVDDPGITGDHGQRPGGGVCGDRREDPEMGKIL